MTSTARRRDARVYTRSHPVLFRLLTGLRGRPVHRLGRTVLVNGEDELRRVLTEVPLDRTDARTTGGAIRRHQGEGALFDETGPGHRAARRALAERLGPRGVEALRPAWAPVLADLAARLAGGETADLCAVADEVSGRTTLALLDLDPVTTDPGALARAARRTASTAAAAELPGPRRRRSVTTDDLDAVLPERDALATMLALAAVNTTYAALPRAVAWTADAGLWDAADDDERRPVLVDELLRVLAPTPLLPRVPAEEAGVGGCPVGPRDRLALVVRHAVDADRRDPSVEDPAPVRTSRLVFGAGAHVCPGAALARAQLDDLLAALAPLRPVVVGARADRHAALPAWGSLVVRSGS